MNIQCSRYTVPSTKLQFWSKVLTFWRYTENGKGLEKGLGLNPARGGYLLDILSIQAIECIRSEEAKPDVKSDDVSLKIESTVNVEHIMDKGRGRSKEKI